MGEIHEYFKYHYYYIEFELSFFVDRIIRVDFIG